MTNESLLRYYFALLFPWEVSRKINYVREQDKICKSKYDGLLMKSMKQLWRNLQKELEIWIEIQLEAHKEMNAEIKTEIHIEFNLITQEHMYNFLFQFYFTIQNLIILYLVGIYMYFDKNILIFVRGI